MKTFKYIILGILATSLMFSSFIQQESFGFFETYSLNEIESRLNPGDQFFKLINAKQTDPGSSKLGTCIDSESSELWKYIQTDSFLKQLPGDIWFAWGAQHNDNHHTLYALKHQANATPGPDQSDIESVTIKKDDRNDSYSLLLSFSDEGAEKWASLTGKNIGRNIAIVIDGKVYAAPKVSEEIKLGKCSISGDFSENELIKLKELLEMPAL